MTDTNKFELSTSIDQFTEHLKEEISENLLTSVLENFLDDQSEGLEDADGEPILTPFEEFLEDTPPEDDIFISLESALQEAAETFKPKLKAYIEAWMKTKASDE